MEEMFELKREKLNAMVKNAIKLQIAEAEACLEQNGGPHLEVFREAGDPFGTPHRAGKRATARVGNQGEPCTWWEAWEIARPWAKDPRLTTAQRLFHPMVAAVNLMSLIDGKAQYKLSISSQPWSRAQSRRGCAPTPILPMVVA